MCWEKGEEYMEGKDAGSGDFPSTCMYVAHVLFQFHGGVEKTHSSPFLSPTAGLGCKLTSFRALGSAGE